MFDKTPLNDLWKMINSSRPTCTTHYILRGLIPFKDAPRVSNCNDAIKHIAEVALSDDVRVSQLNIFESQGRLKQTHEKLYSGNDLPGKEAVEALMECQRKFGQ